MAERLTRKTVTQAAAASSGSAALAAAPAKVRAKLHITSCSESGSREKARVSSSRAPLLRSRDERALIVQAIEPALWSNYRAASYG